MGRYVAVQPLTIDGEIREPGQEVPEAVGWQSVELWVIAGEIDYIPDDGENYLGPRCGIVYGSYGAPVVEAVEAAAIAPVVNTGEPPRNPPQRSTPPKPSQMRQKGRR